jgi:RNase H-like domain found in reverse transcriptase/Integrase zinc binding domain/Integrase core domain/Reverse transcriptase (RNA-dependent DNA polymerase)
MELVMSGLTYDICLVYLDDILVFSKDFTEHLNRLGMVFERLEKHTLKLKSQKCFLFQRKVSFLGHVVSEEGVACDPDKISAVSTWPRPQSVSEVRTFTGLASYYRSYVKDFAHIAKPLHELTKKNARFEWTVECERSFEELKSRLTSAPILANPQDEGTFVLDADASDFALGAVLQQEQGGTLKVIGYASRALSDAERRYCITRKELLGVIFGLKKFRQHLLAREIIVRTDHAALTSLFRTPEPIGQQGRWMDLLGEYFITIQHRPGRVHSNSDALSRRPCERDESMPCRQCHSAAGRVSTKDDYASDVKLGRSTSLWLENATSTASKMLSDEIIPTMKLLDSSESLLPTTEREDESRLGCYAAGLKDPDKIYPIAVTSFPVQSVHLGFNVISESSADRNGRCSQRQDGRSTAGSEDSDETELKTNSENQSLSTSSTGERQFKSRAARRADGQAALLAVGRLCGESGGQVASVADNERTGSTGIDANEMTSSQSKCVAVSRSRAEIAVDMDRCDDVDVSGERWSNGYSVNAECNQADGHAYDGSSSLAASGQRAVVDGNCERQGQEYSAEVMLNQVDDQMARDIVAGTIAESLTNVRSDWYADGGSSSIAASGSADVSDERWSYGCPVNAEYNQADGHANDGGSSVTASGQRAVVDCSCEPQDQRYTAITVLKESMEDAQTVIASNSVSDSHACGQMNRVDDGLVQQVAAIEVDAADETERSTDEVGHVTSLSLDDIRAAQEDDDSIRIVMEMLGRCQEPPDWNEMQRHQEDARVLLTQWQSLLVVDGVLYRRFHRADGVTKYLQIVLSERLRSPYLKRLHEEIGHFGQAKTCAAAAERVYFPGWRKYTNLIVRNCTVCNLHQRGRQPPKQTALQPMKVFRPMAVLHADLVGPLPEGRTDRGQRGFRYVLSVIDACTRYMWLIPLKDKTAEGVAKALFDEIISKVSTPSAILTDQGGEFQGDVMRHLCRRMGIDRLRTSSYHPQTDAKAERAHFSVHNLIVKLADGNYAKWPDLLNNVARSYNMTVHSATNYSPHELFYSFRPCCALDVLTDSPMDDSVSNADEFALQLAERMQEAFAFVRKFNGRQVDRMKRYYDASVKPKQFKVNDFVLLYCPKRKRGQYGRWQITWTGPYRVVRCINQSIYAVRKTEKSRDFIVHGDRLKAYFGDMPGGWKKTATSDMKTRPETLIPGLIPEVIPALSTGVGSNVEPVLPAPGQAILTRPEVNPRVTSPTGRANGSTLGINAGVQRAEGDSQATGPETKKRPAPPVQLAQTESQPAKLPTSRPGTLRHVRRRHTAKLACCRVASGISLSAAHGLIPLIPIETLGMAERNKYGHRIINITCRLCTVPSRVFATVSGLNKHSVSVHQHFYRANGDFVPIPTEDLMAARQREHPGWRHGKHRNGKSHSKSSPSGRAMRVSSGEPYRAPTPDLRHHLESQGESRTHHWSPNSPGRQVRSSVSTHRRRPSSTESRRSSEHRRSSPSRRIGRRLSSTVSSVNARTAAGENSAAPARFSPLRHRFHSPTAERRDLVDHRTVVSAVAESTPVHDADVYDVSIIATVQAADADDGGPPAAGSEDSPPSFDVESLVSLSELRDLEFGMNDEESWGSPHDATVAASPASTSVGEGRVPLRGDQATEDRHPPTLSSDVLPPTEPSDNSGPDELPERPEEAVPPATWFCYSDAWAIARTFQPAQLPSIVDSIMTHFRVPYTQREVSHILLAMHFARAEVAREIRDLASVATIATGQPASVLVAILLQLDHIRDGMALGRQGTSSSSAPPSADGQS